MNFFFMRSDGSKDPGRTVAKSKHHNFAALPDLAAHCQAGGEIQFREPACFVFSSTITEAFSHRAERNPAFPIISSF